MTPLPPLSFGVFRFEIRCLTPMHLRPFVTSTLRGAFGAQFRRMVCLTRQKTCEGCVLRTQCPYGVLFDPIPPPQAARLRHFSNIPRGYVLNASALPENNLQPADTFSFDLTLVGHTARYLPYFIYVFRALEEAGLGAQREEGHGRFELAHVRALIPNGGSEVIFDRKEDALRASTDARPITDWLPENQTVPNQLTLRFTTPTQIKHERTLVEKPDFHHVVRSFFRRLSNLSLFYNDQPWTAHYTELFEAATQMQTTRNQTFWVRKTRYSARAQTELFVDGFTGVLTVQGNLEPFWPLLSLGQWLHTGSNTVFGMGRFVCEV